jgi:hypothetical protein
MVALGAPVGSPWNVVFALAVPAPVHPMVAFGWAGPDGAPPRLYTPHLVTCTLCLRTFGVPSAAHLWHHFYVYHPWVLPHELGPFYMPPSSHGRTGRGDSRLSCGDVEANPGPVPEGGDDMAVDMHLDAPLAVANREALLAGLVSSPAPPINSPMAPPEAPTTPRVGQGCLAVRGAGQHGKRRRTHHPRVLDFPAEDGSTPPVANAHVADEVLLDVIVDVSRDIIVDSSSDGGMSQPLPCCLRPRRSRRPPRIQMRPSFYRGQCVPLGYLTVFRGLCC